MKHLTIAAGMVSMLAVPAAAATLDGAVGYGLAGGGNQLIVYGNLSDTSMQTTLTLSGGKLDALAYRPVTGELYGYSVGSGSNADTVYKVDLETGALIGTGSTFGPGAEITGNARVGFDFNNAIDAARAVSTREDNLVFFPSDTVSGNPNAGSVLRFTDLFYGAGDANEGVNPMVFANAYTNAIDGRVATAVDGAVATFQYALDAYTNSLVSLANNDGTLSTIAQVTYEGMVLDFSDRGGFEILSMTEGDNLAVAMLNVAGGPATGTSGLYTIDLMTGVASFFGDAGRSGLIGFAAQTGTPSEVPLPASALLLGAGLAGLGFLRKRSRKTA